MEQSTLDVVQSIEVANAARGCGMSASSLLPLSLLHYVRAALDDDNSSIRNQSWTAILPFSIKLEEYSFAVSPQGSSLRLKPDGDASQPTQHAHIPHSLVEP
ncbi:hypothetical protein ACG7TL_001640 [Trametes sanguinea]